jgi:hypothetical protein
MKKLVCFALLLMPYLALSQETPSQDIKKMVDDKSFVFVATASSGDQPQFFNFWQTVYGPAPMSVAKMQSLEKNADLGKSLRLLAYAQSSMQSVADKMTGSKSEVRPVVYVHDVSALFDPSIFQPAFNELIGRNPDSLNNPFAFENYTVKTNKRGKITVEFKVSDDLYNRTINMIISPEGKAQMTIATAVKRYNDARRTKQYYKGYIQELASL